ncbi:hypothetical protein AWENTII_002171 [Aspergillus wentii]
MEAANSQQTKFDLPGLNLPLNFRPKGGIFQNALDHGEIQDIGTQKTLWEIRMMQIMNSITDKPEWYEKVFNERIVKKWREELTASDVDLTSGMIDWIFEELKYKSSPFQQTGMVTAFDADVVKSDSAIPEELRLALMSAVRPLEEVPEEEKDYHPFSDEKVVDLVHPSLFPLVYGRSRMLKDKITTLERFMEYPGKGDVVPIPPEKETRVDGFHRQLRDTPGRNPFSQRFQWLPCDVELNKDSNDCRIVSYINNLHPHKNGGLYDIIQQIITRTIPLWNATLTPVLDSLYFSNNRIEYTYVDCSRGNTPEPTQKRIFHSDGGSETDESDQDDFWDRLRDWEHSRPVRPPGIGAFRPLIGDDKEKVDLQTAFKDTGLQVIVKLANIELTPEKPHYAGGSWHVEGQLNEHICATAIYYYSNDNITTNTLCFRQRLNTTCMGSQIGYQQGHVEWTEPVFGCEEDGPVTRSRWCILSPRPSAHLPQHPPASRVAFSPGRSN